jgi:small subunit ribosomal protein S6e
MTFKLVVSDPKTKKSYQKEISQKESGMLGRKIRDVVKGDSSGFPGYEFEITGGSDKQGFPMRQDIQGPARKRVLLVGGTGFHPKRKGERKRTSVRGNTVSSEIAQVNTKIVKHGPKHIEELMGVKKEEKPAEEHKKEEHAEHKEEHKHEEHAEHKHEEKPAEHAEHKHEEKAEHHEHEKKE